jgi:hypothetical protein
VGLQNNGRGLGKLTGGEGRDRRLRGRWRVGGEKRGGIAGDARAWQRRKALGARLGAAAQAKAETRWAADVGWAPKFLSRRQQVGRWAVE